jgi:hypothetical protein
MERCVIRERVASGAGGSGFASLHPGYTVWPSAIFNSPARACEN